MLTCPWPSGTSSPQVPGTFVTKKKNDYQFEDAAGKSIALPGKPYVALRIMEDDDG